MADLNGALASIRFGVDALQKLCAKYGSGEVQHYMQALKMYTSTCLLESLEDLKGDTYEAQEKLDDGSHLQVRISKSKQHMEIDFSGSAPVHHGNLNATEAIVTSAVIYVLRLLIQKSIPLNEGIMQNIRINLPVSILNPEFPDNPFESPAVVGGNTETSQRLVDTLIKALQLSACSQGTMNNLLFGDDTFGYYETIGGGVGAGKGFDGAHAIHQHMTNTRITDPEIMEYRYPVRLDTFAIRSGSGGNGQWKGGNGIIRKLTFLKPVEVTLLSQHRKEAPYGMSGGQAGATGEQYVFRHGASKETLEGIAQTTLSAGDSIVVMTPGGGGYGAVDS
jgi:5-oxoprolinase (ATP-hydrolysing)